MPRATLLPAFLVLPKDILFKFTFFDILAYLMFGIVLALYEIGEKMVLDGFCYEL